MLKSVEAEYVAWIVCEPTLRLVIELEDAWPTPSRVTPEPTLVPSTSNWTVPVGVPAPGEVGDTVAVNVTPWP